MTEKVQKLFHKGNELLSLKVTVQDGTAEYIIDPELLVTFDTEFSNESPEVNAELVLRDLYAMNIVVNWYNAKITLSYMDLFNELTEKTYYVNGVINFEYGIYKKALKIYMQDEFSYKLGNSFLGKGFTSITIDAIIKQYIDNLSLESPYQIDFEEVPLLPGESEEFVVPRNENNLGFFIRELDRRGFSFYQTRTSLVIKNEKKMTLSALEALPEVFTDETRNQLYMNKILDGDIHANNQIIMMPKRKTFVYDPKKKQMLTDDYNSNEKLLLNQDSTNIQTTVGYSEVYGLHNDFGEHYKQNKNTLLKQNGIDITVSGYTSREVNKICELSLHGNIVSTKASSLGDVINSGKYLCTTVQDKIVGTNFIQKLSLRRADAQQEAQD